MKGMMGSSVLELLSLFIFSFLGCVLFFLVTSLLVVVHNTVFFSGGGFLLDSILFYGTGTDGVLTYIFLLLEGVLILTVVAFKSSQKALVLVEMLVLIGFITYLTVNNSHNLFITSTVLITVSVCSLYLVLGTSGSSVDVSCLFFFKFIPDMTVLLLLGVFGLFGIYYNLSTMNPVSSFVYQHLDLMGVVMVFYSLLGVFGFWIFWSMESSYFVSCYMHTCGLVFVGVYFFFVLSSYGCLGSYKIIYVCCCVSFMSTLLFLLFFLCVGNIKSSLGFFSASSICYVFLFLVVAGPYVGLLGFFISSVIKVGLFYLVESVKDSSLSSTSSVVLVVVFTLLCVSLHYYVFPCVYYLLSSGVSKGSLSFLLYKYPCLTSFMVYLIPILEVFCVMLHLVSVVISCSKGGDSFYLSSFKFNVIFIEAMHVLFNVFLVLELCLTWGVKFHGHFMLLFLLVLLCLFFVGFFFMGVVSSFECFISGCLISGLRFTFGVTIMNSSGTTYYSYHSLFYNIINCSMGSASIGVILVLFILLLLICYYAYFIYDNCFMSSSLASLKYTYDLFGNKVVNPFTKGGSSMSTSSQLGKSGWDMLQVSKSLGFQFSSSPFSGYSYDCVDSKLNVEGYFGGSPVGVKLLICDSVFSLDMSLVTSKMSGYKIQMYYTFIMLTVFSSKFLAALFGHWVYNFWLMESEEWSSLVSESVVYNLNSTSDTSFKHILKLITHDFWSEFNSTSALEQLKCGLYGLYSYSKWLVTFGWAGDFIEGEPYFYYGSTYFSSKDYPDIFTDEVFTGDIALLWEIFSSVFLYKAYVSIPLGVEEGDFEGVVEVIASSLGARYADGSILMVEHPVLDDALYLSLFLEPSISEMSSCSLMKEKYLEDILAMSEGDVYLVDKHNELKKEGKLFPWFLYDGVYSMVMPHLPTDPEFPISMWDFKDSVSMGLFPFNFSSWTVSEVEGGSYLIGSSDFVTDLVESGEQVDDMKSVPKICQWMSWILLCGYPMSDSVSDKFKMKHDSLKWSSEFYLHDDDDLIPQKPY